MNGLARWWMRSDLLFTLSAKVTNRYLLCRMLSASVRKMHRVGSLPAESINRSVQTLLDSERPGKKPFSSAQPDDPAREQTLSYR
jgi:hypothetical protein